MTDAGFDVAIIGGGVVGASAAAYLAEAGARVVLVERDDIAAAASGRNSGAIQHPFDPFMAALHRESVALYRAPEMEVTDFQLAAEPVGLLLLSPDSDAVAAAVASIRETAPEVDARVLGSTELHALEPGLADDLIACRLETGYPVAPAAATKAFAARARRAGATVRIAAPARIEVGNGTAVGVRLADGTLVSAGHVLVAAGPWTPSLVPGWQDEPPIRSVWGVVVSAALGNPPRAVLEELGIDRPGRAPDELFSLVTAGADTSVGSTFLAARPDPQERVAAILARAARYVPALAEARPASARSCARPASFDGRPLIGAVPHVDRLFVCAGHGAWGISTGPASARLVADAMLTGIEPVPELSAGRELRVG
jgi:glycine/D-amino acid oxidase-like deaminating enzyme